MFINVAFTCFSVLAVYVTPVGATSLQANAEDLSLSTVTPTVVSEETSLRDVNSKHFLMSDGTYAAVAYDIPVHYEENDKWIEIDNTLVPATMVGDSVTGKVVRDSELALDAAVQQAVTSRDGATYYENKQNDFIVQLPQALTDDKPIIVNNDGHSLRFFATDVEQSAAAELSQPRSETEIEQALKSRLATTTDQAQQAKIQNDIATSAHNIRSAVSYAEIQEDVDINYYVYGQTLKEDIVLHRVPSATSFSFRFAFDGLRAVMQEDNSVLFYNAADEAVFVIAAPYMADFDEGYSRDIKVVLSSTDTGCVYTLIPDREWLEAPERVYPVTLDPHIQSTQNTNYIHDAGVQQSNPTEKYYKLDRIYVGSGTSSTEGRMYFKLAQWPSATNLNAASITKAELALNYYPQANWQTGNNITINVARVTSAWDATTLDWNSRPSVGSTLVDYNNIDDVRGKISGADVYEVTSWVKAHYSNASTDYGICLYPSTVKTFLNRVCYISSDYYTNTLLRPIITIYYLSFVGVKGVRSSPASSYPTYNCQSYAFWLTPTSGTNVFTQLTDSDVYYCRNTTVANALARTKTRMVSWLNANFPNKWREVSSYDATLKSNEWLVCMRVGVVNGEYDYHFWYRANNGSWYNKHGYYYPSEKVSGDIIIPSTANDSNDWKVGSTYFYTSNTVYYAIQA